MEYNEKYIKGKEEIARKKFVPTIRSESERLPPGQHVTNGFPVLDLGVQPLFDPRTWKFGVMGEVERPTVWTYEEFLKLPKTESVSDFHCVTSWSKFDVKWGGIRLLDLMDWVGVKPTAKHLLQSSSDGYTTNVPMEDVMRNDTLLAYELDGAPLPREHGGPVRVIIPQLYAWKGAKFTIKLTFSATDEPGFWEVRGYHNHGDPWTEERYS